MNHAERFDQDAAARIARAIEASEDPQVSIEFSPREWVNEWFADVYGWPLTHGQRALRDEFLAMVTAEMAGEPA